MSDQKLSISCAPWTPEQVEALNDYQRRGWMHPFTCGVCRDKLGTECSECGGVNDRKLIATEAGWICPTCDYTQNWAHQFMVTPRPDEMYFFPFGRELPDNAANR